MLNLLLFDKNDVGWYFCKFIFISIIFRTDDYRSLAIKLVKGFTYKSDARVINFENKRRDNYLAVSKPISILLYNLKQKYFPDLQQTTYILKRPH